MKRVILADDHESLRTAVGDLLADEFRVTAVADGTEVLAALERGRTDLILTDLAMPRMDGMELLRELRRRSDVPPVIVMSSDVIVPDGILAATALALGAAATIQKPFDADDLLGLVREVLAEREAT